MVDFAELNDESDRETLRVYCQHQYERLHQLEEQRMTPTNVVVAASVIGLAVLFDTDGGPGGESAWALLAIVLSNAFAIGFLLRTKAFVSIHQSRARHALGSLVPDLLQLGLSSDKPGRWFHSRNEPSARHKPLLVRREQTVRNRSRERTTTPQACSQSFRFKPIRCLRPPNRPPRSASRIVGAHTTLGPASRTRP